MKIGIDETVCQIIRMVDFSDTTPEREAVFHEIKRIIQAHSSPQEAEKLALEVENRRLREVIQEIQEINKAFSTIDPCGGENIAACIYDALQTQTPDPSLLLAVLRAAIDWENHKSRLGMSDKTIERQVYLSTCIKALPSDVREMLGVVKPNA